MTKTAILLATLTFHVLGASQKQDLVLYRHEGRYSAFPSLYGRGNELWVGFGWNTTRSHYGRAAGGQTGSVMLYSPDGGRAWLEKGKDGYREPPPEKSWFVLRDGTRLQIAPLMHEVLPAESLQILNR